MAHVIPITDADDPALSDFFELTDVALRRKIEPQRGIYLAESSKVIGRALAAGHVPLAAVTGPKTLQLTLAQLSTFDVPVFSASEQTVESVTGFHLHRGAIASMRRPEPRSLEEVLRHARLVVVLEDLADHSNVGAIFRAVAALGADAVLVTPRCADPLYRRSIRVSMGAVFQVPWTRLVSWPRDIERVREEGFSPVALALTDDAVDLRSFCERRPDRVALIVGSEGDGLSTKTLARVDCVVRIPMRAGIDSLNVASAAAVAVHALT